MPDTPLARTRKLMPINTPPPMTAAAHQKLRAMTAASSAMPTQATIAFL